MNIEDFRELVLQLPHVTEDVKWENHLCFCIGKKMFAIVGMDETPITASFKVNDNDFEELRLRDGCKPAPYLARYKWIHTNDIIRFSEKEWRKYIGKSYEMVKRKLPKKVQINLV